MWNWLLLHGSQSSGSTSLELEDTLSCSLLQPAASSLPKTITSADTPSSYAAELQKRLPVHLQSSSLFHVNLLVCPDCFFFLAPLNCALSSPRRFFFFVRFFAHSHCQPPDAAQGSLSPLNAPERLAQLIQVFFCFRRRRGSLFHLFPSALHPPPANDHLPSRLGSDPVYPSIVRIHANPESAKWEPFVNRHLPSICVARYEGINTSAIERVFDSHTFVFGAFQISQSTALTLDKGRPPCPL